MRLSVVVSTVVLLACAGLATAAAVRTPPPVREAATGMDILRGYKCRRAETKTIIVRGMEDNHVPVGVEPNFIRPGRRFPDNLTYFAGGSYDQIEADRRWTDSFAAPRHTAHGLLVLGLRPVAANESDTMAVGDLSTLTFNTSGGGRMFAAVAELERQPGWSRKGHLFMAELDDIRINARSSRGHGSVLDLIRAGASDGWIDVLVQDDTSVDFLGVALCLEPPRGKGLTLAPTAADPPPVKDVAILTCSYGGRGHANCDQYVGDTVCSTALPVACFRPMASPVPRGVEGHYAATVWSGGRVAYTEPTPGSRFARSADVNAFCAARFGPGWRVAELHDGNGNADIAAFGDPKGLTSRAWVDVIGAPYATCWAR